MSMAWRQTCYVWIMLLLNASGYLEALSSYLNFIITSKLELDTGI